MFKVIIADDEAHICRLVRMLADWDALGMEVVATAENGPEALELIKGFLPHILITDIRMPGCDGLELIEKARKFAPNLEIIIISGYAEFEYAQTAIKHNVSGYLLKPIKKAALTATLGKLGDRLRERDAADEEFEHLRNDGARSRAILQRSFIERLANNLAGSPTRDQMEREYGFPVRDGLLQVVIFKVDYNPDGAGEHFLDAVINKAEEGFKENVLPLCLAGMMHFYLSSGIGVLNYTPQNQAAARNALRHFLNFMEAQKSLFGPAEFTLAAGGAYKTAEELPVSMREAYGAACERLLEGTGRLLDAAAVPARNKPFQLPDAYVRDIANAVSVLDAAEADGAADGLFAETGDLRGFELLDLAVCAGKKFISLLNYQEGVLADEFVRRCHLCSGADKLFSYLKEFQRRQISEAIARRENEAIRPVRIAKQYIQDHYSEPVTLEDVCGAINFSVSYFSTMFKKATGEGFAKYLTRVRIEKAKNLLQDTGLPISEICERVGYNDLKHFTGTFKKMTSLNPVQYRKLYG